MERRSVINGAAPLDRATRPISARVIGPRMNEYAQVGLSC
jgi:hypothetical protein